MATPLQFHSLAANEFVELENENNAILAEFPVEEIGNEFTEDFGAEFPTEQQANEFVDEEFGPEFVPEWNLIADGDGNMHLSNLHEETPEINPTFNVNTDVIFRVFTRRNPTAGQVITVGNAASVSNSNFRSSDPTR